MTIFFNAFHSPLAAHSSFTLGCKGKSGGLGLEMGTPACENVYIGLQNRDDENYSSLPFYEVEESESNRYDNNGKKIETKSVLSFFDDKEISRNFKTGTDIWNAGDLTCSIYSAPVSAPDPAVSSLEEQMLAYCPAVVLELKIDNRNCANERTAFYRVSR